MWKDFLRPGRRLGTETFGQNVLSLELIHTVSVVGSDTKSEVGDGTPGVFSRVTPGRGRENQTSRTQRTDINWFKIQCEFFKPTEQRKASENAHTGQGRDGQEPDKGQGGAGEVDQRQGRVG